MFCELEPKEAIVPRRAWSGDSTQGSLTLRGAGLSERPGRAVRELVARLWRPVKGGVNFGRKVCPVKGTKMVNEFRRPWVNQMKHLPSGRTSLSRHVDVRSESPRSGCIVPGLQIIFLHKLCPGIISRGGCSLQHLLGNAGREEWKHLEQWFSTWAAH